MVHSFLLTNILYFVAVLVHWYMHLLIVQIDTIEKVTMDIKEEKLVYTLQKVCKILIDKCNLCIFCATVETCLTLLNTV
jgi:hypothetical protein